MIKASIGCYYKASMGTAMIKASIGCYDLIGCYDKIHFYEDYGSGSISL